MLCPCALASAQPSPAPLSDPPTSASRGGTVRILIAHRPRQRAAVRSVIGHVPPRPSARTPRAARRAAAAAPKSKEKFERPVLVARGGRGQSAAAAVRGGRCRPSVPAARQPSPPSQMRSPVNRHWPWLACPVAVATTPPLPLPPARGPLQMQTYCCFPNFVRCGQNQHWARVVFSLVNDP